jgi:hypothetical protein
MNLKPALLATVAALGMTYGSAYATVIITQGPGSTQNTDNVVFNACSGNIAGPALMVQGCLNSDHSTLVDFTGTENLVVNGGQARIEAQTGTFDALQINFDPLATSAFATLIFNIDAANTGTITIFGDAITGADATQSFAVGQAGQNFFRVDASNGQLLRSVSFTGLTVNSVQFSDVQQVRIGGPGVSLPEPGALLLLATVLGGIGLTTRRKTAR